MNAIEVRMKTPITYYGGKQKMLKIILPMIPEHDIYVEPFFWWRGRVLGKRACKR